MAKTVLTVFTFRPIELILEEGGSQAWALNADNARRCTRLVCTRNRFHEGSGPEEHGAAFLVGKISGIEPSPENPERFIVRISEYALLEPQPIVWPGARNPVWYVEDLSDLQIDESALEWHAMPETGAQNADAPILNDRPSKLTIAEAKAALAVTFGVSPEDIEIIIRG